ncbi:MAG: hypothetical protein Q9217_000933 [Psora testacea]
MNSLNILSARVIGQTLPGHPSKERPRSYSDGTVSKANPEFGLRRSASQDVKRVTTRDEEKEDGQGHEAQAPAEDSGIEVYHSEIDEKTPFLRESTPMSKYSLRYSKLRLAAKRLVDALTASLKWVLSTLVSPGVYVVTGFYDEKGHFSPLIPVRRLGRLFPKRNGRKSTTHAVGLSGSSGAHDENSYKGITRRKGRSKDTKSAPQGADRSATATSDSETDASEKMILLESPTRSRPPIRTSSSSEEVPEARRSVRVRLNTEDGTRRRKQNRGKGDSASTTSSTSNDGQPPLTVATIKSPTSPASSLRMTKYPRALPPPRPLIPRRQPSYSAHTPRSSGVVQKTLVIDLDETLIHSLAQGGRMSSGHMVEVKLNTSVGYGGATLGPQHPILYYVHKRPHCDDFLRKVCKWYKLVVFTASVQEYADPVIDWLEQERKFFSGRFYRQHCTFRNGAYIKDLSSVEPDLSKVMILDNSPLSYVFHEGELRVSKHTIILSDTRIDNAIPIEGWINDPTDNDLLHLVPILEALQYVTDVRALLALRRGEVKAQR